MAELMGERGQATWRVTVPGPTLGADMKGRPSEFAGFGDDDQRQAPEVLAGVVEFRLMPSALHGDIARHAGRAFPFPVPDDPIEREWERVDP